MPNNSTILLCTVGGSHQPIVSAINDVRPDHVVFICTDKDPGTGRPGSRSQIEGKGQCIRAHPADEKPTLPAIPEQAGLSAESYEIVITAADDLDVIYRDCHLALRSIRERFPRAQILADYTGGTKSMSAGLVMAALEHSEIELQLVTGNRADLIKVHDGWQTTAQANIEQIRLQRTLDPYRHCWERYAYGEAATGLKTLPSPAGNVLRSYLNRFRDLSTAFAAWDNFNHREALQIIQRYAPGLAPDMKAYIGIAMRLNDNNAQKRDAARLLDLYLNAQRRAAQERYDDAIARIYRLLEWTAQWLLRHQCGIDTANVPAAQIPDGMALTRNREGQWQAGLFNAWKLLGHKTRGAAAEFIAHQEPQLLNQIQIRNQSILAHGYAPVSREHWLQFGEFIEDQFIPMLLAETACVGIKSLPEQLPRQYPMHE